MRRTRIQYKNHEIPIITADAVVVGSGAAGLNAADRLHALGRRDIVIVTENMNAGTSRNAGSDKQTYYKLTLAGDTGDSVRGMARTLFAGGAMHGDIALIEAALSARCFHRLVELGVLFPDNEYGEFAGYKTDHDPHQRATSAGPLTSRYMTEALEREVRRKNIPIFDRYQVVALFTDEERTRVRGFMALDLDNCGDPDRQYVLFNCADIVWATGGPAGIFGSSVYPESQHGATGVALEAGAEARNLTEWQFGLASTHFRWNLSGTYQQVLPRYVSTDGDGSDEREFLSEWFPSPGALLDAVFLKGYQWPFDSRKVADSGSSFIDLLVYRERVMRGRRVFLDYSRNHASAGGSVLDFGLPGKEVRSYLEKSDALLDTPIDRLIRMNPDAYDLFVSHGIDLRTDPLEISVCAQHNNGGLAGDIDWQSNLRHFYPVGEANGSHGVYRPGGSALNSGQVGGLRAAEHIARVSTEDLSSAEEFFRSVCGRFEHVCRMGEVFLAGEGHMTVADLRSEIQSRSDRYAGIIRDADSAIDGYRESHESLAAFASLTRLSSPEELGEAFRNRDLLVAQCAILASIADYIGHGGTSHGSFVVRDDTGDTVHPGLGEAFRIRTGEDLLAGSVQTLAWGEDGPRFRWGNVRPIPDADVWFETVWNDFRKRMSSDGNASATL